MKVVSSPDGRLARDAAKNGWHYVEVEGAPEVYDGDGVTRVEGISYKYDGEDYIAVRNDSKKYTKEKLYYHEKAHKEVASGRVDLKTIAKTVVETGRGDADVATLVDAYLTAYENTMPLDEIIEEILADTKANMDRFGVKGAKKAMDTLRRAFGKVYEQSRSAKTSDESETKLSRAEDNRRGKRSAYNEYNTLGMRWAYSSDTQIGDVKVQYNGRTGQYNLIEATKEDVGFIPIASGSLEEMRRLKDAYINTTAKEYDRYVQVAGAERGNDSWDNDDVGYLGEESRDGGLPDHGVRQGEQAPDRTADTSTVEGDTAAVRGSERRSGVKYSRDTDSTGRELSEGQQEYFKDSKIRDEEGRLQVVYHGTEADFTVFDTSIQGGKNGDAEGFGIYITPSKAIAEHYGGRQMEMYANITKPARSDVKTIGVMKLAKLIESTARAEAKFMLAIALRRG